MSSVEHNFQSRSFELLAHRYWLTLAISILVMAIFASGLPRLNTVEVGLRNHFSEDDPLLVNLEKFEDAYAVSDSLLLVVEPPGDNIFTAEVLTVIEQLTDELWLTPYATRVSSLSNHSHTEAREDDLFVEDLVQDAALLDEIQINRIREIALTTKETAGRFVSYDGQLAGLIINVALPDEGRSEARKKVIKTFQDIVNQQQSTNPDYSFYAYGELLLQRAIGDAIDEDMSLLAPLAFGTMLIVAFLLLRTVWGVLAIVIMLVATMTSSFGFAGWSGLKFFGESGATVFVLMAIVVAHSVHLIQGVINGMLTGMPRSAAIIHSLEVNFRPIFLTSLTTSIGFLSLNFSEMPPFRVMGNIVAFGSMIAFIYAVVLLPSLIAIMPMKAPPQGKHITRNFERLGGFVVNKSKIMLWVFGLLFVFSAIGVSRIELDDNNVKLLPASHELRQSADFISDQFSGLDTFEYSLDSGRDGGITDVDYLYKVDEFSNWLRQQPEVSHVTSIVDILKRLNKNLHGDAEEAYVLPENSDLAAQYLVLYEFSLPVGLDLNNLINFDRSATRMTVVIQSMSVKQQIDLDNRANAWLAENAPEMQTGATGVIIIGAYSVMKNIVKMLVGTGVAMSIVSLILVFVFKSVRLGLLSLIPNFLPAVMALGIWGYAVGTVSIAVSIVTAIAFGIVVDDTIHLLSKYLRSRHGGLSAPESIVPTFSLVGRPLLTTTLIFALGFFMFGASGLWTNQVLGLLVGMTVIIALIADFLLFPPLLVVLDKSKAALVRNDRQRRKQR
ncbi:MAG: MMPL family transporter [Gammaproteobacteria bacterium]|nr:MMPL family transporter [Gammaproteobacteria bacterium]